MADGGLITGDLLQLPGQIQLAIGSGYAAYLLSYVGIREHHSTIDIAFKSLVFSLIATASFGFLNSFILNAYIRGVLAFLICCSCGLIWRRFFREYLRVVLRYLNISWSDDDPSALTSILGSSENAMSQLSILLDDGSWLICDNLARFEKSPFGPCKLGTNGDVAMYVTHVKSKGSFLAKAVLRSQSDVSNNVYGDNITYIPPSKINYVKMRYKKN